MSEGHFEAKVSAKRETKDGIFITLQVQPDDYSAALASLRVGTALMIGWSMIVDTKCEPIKINAEEHAAKKDKRPFDSLPYSQQAGIRCQEQQFASFAANYWYEGHIDTMSNVDPVTMVRLICDVPSRSELDKNELASNRWKELEAKYQAYLTDLRYGSGIK